MLHPSGVEELPGVAPVIVHVGRAQDFADAQHVGAGDSLEGPGVLVAGGTFVLLLVQLRQTLSAHHLHHTHTLTAQKHFHTYNPPVVSALESNATLLSCFSVLRPKLS